MPQQVDESGVPNLFGLFSYQRAPEWGIPALQRGCNLAAQQATEYTLEALTWRYSGLDGGVDVSILIGGMAWRLR
jgi:hypothetical protein